ncbi:MAG TPA: hypothetical protein PLQ95_04040 [Thiobacillus sp.]|nr:hypothetical protein [Thiobacillus sp.]
MRFTRAKFKLLAMLLLGLSASVQAETSNEPVTAIFGGAFDDAAFDGAAISDDMLDGQRGMALITNTNDLDGAVHNNSASELVTGYNLVSDGSLVNNSGFNTVIQNSGNNVLIQNAVILNIQMQ